VKKSHPHPHPAVAPAELPVEKKSLPGHHTIAERLQAAAELLEAVAADRALLAQMSAEERARLLQAAGDVFCPDVGERRRLTKAKQRHHKAKKRERDDKVLTVTGIRALRRKPVFTTPPPPNNKRLKILIFARWSNRRIVTFANATIHRFIISTISYARRVRN
jgi:hypothetical protein